MTPKEKASDIVDRYIQLLPYHSKQSNLKRAKDSALIAVDEIIQQNNIWIAHAGKGTNNYWEEVKQEINNL